MFNLTFEFDEAGYDASTQAFLDGALQPALVGAVNDAAAQVARGIGGFLAASLDKATNFTTHAGGWLPANQGNADPAALVFLRRRQAVYLGYEVYGGTRVGGDPGTLPDCVLVPARDTVLDAEGNPVWDQVDADLTDPRARWISLGPPGDRMLVRDEGGRTLFLLGEVAETHYDPSVDFFGWVTRVATAAMAERIGAAVSEAGAG